MSSFLSALSYKGIQNSIICGGNITMNKDCSEVYLGCKEEVQNILHPFMKMDSTSLCWWFVASFKDGLNYCWMRMQHPSDGTLGRVTD